MKLFNIKNIQFNQILSDVKSFLARINGGTVNINQSSVFGQLITIVSSVAHNIMLYIEDALTEQNKYTAQRKKSIFGLAVQSGYQPSYGRAAGVWLKIAYKANNGNPLDAIIQDKTKLICSQNGLYYVLDLGTPAINIKCDTGSENRFYYAIQGRYETQRFTSTGGRLYVQNLKFIGYIDTNYIDVYVNGERWEQAASLYDMSPNKKQYTIRYSPINGVDILFGNDRYGKSLERADIIEIKYLIHDGESGNVTVDDNTYFLFASPIKDTNGDEIDGNTVFEIRFSSKDAVSAGSNSEGADVVRNMIGFNSRALVLADSNNYKSFLNKFSFVGYNRTWSEPGSLIMNSLVMKNYRLAMSSGKSYFDLTDSDFILSDMQKTSIKNALINSGMQLAGSTYNILDIELCKYVAFIYIKLKNTSTDKNAISTRIKNVVGAFFGDIQSDQYIPKSDIIHALKSNIDEIDGVSIYFLSEANENAIRNGYYVDKEYTWDPAKGTYSKSEQTIQVYAGENPNLGLDAHGNIVVKSDEQFPVLMGGWSWVNDDNTISTTTPITIVYED